MLNITATFNNIISLKKLIRKLRKNPKVKGHILVIHEKEQVIENEKYISSILIKRSKEISTLGLDNTLKGIIFGSIIGGLSSAFAILFNVNLLGLSTIVFLGILAIIFYGAAVGSILGLLINNLISKYYEWNFDGEVTLILREVDDEVRDIVIDTVKEHNPGRIRVY